MRIENHLLVKEEGDPYNIWFDRSPNVGGSMTASHVVLHATQGPFLGSISWFKQVSGTSTHLIISEDGDDIVQMVPFNRTAVHAHDYNRNSIGIELEYPGPLLASRSIAYRYIERFAPNQRFETAPQNDTRVRTWPAFQPAQIETLIKVTRLIQNTYSVTSILRHEDINAGKLDPGPMFPIQSFRERLAEKRESILEKTRRDIHLHTGPGPNFPNVLPSALPADTNISVVGERLRWALVEVMDEVDGVRYAMGWLPLEWIKVGQFTPVIIDHRLAAAEGGFAKMVTPAPGNYDPKGKLKAIKYIVMHVTGGTNMQGVVNYFKSPSSGVSAHLVIGRDGRVVQFIPFDGVAFHSGFSFWEGDENLNQLSIGIEIDNAAYLRGGPGNWSFKGVPFDDSQVVELTHWKHFRPRGWEKFPELQLEVAYAITEALVKKYGIRELIGHDEVNIENRLDPGPAFPLQEWRERLWPGQGKPEIRVFRVNEDAEIFEPAGQKSPAQNSALLGRLGGKSRIQVRDEVGKWVLVRVVMAADGTTNKSRINGQLGWIERRVVGSFAGALRNLSETDIYEQSSLSAKAGPPLLSAGTLPRGIRVRRQVERRDGWSLVLTIEPLGRLPYLEGWVRTSQLVDAANFVEPAPVDE